jgi:hypothetical protein
MGVPPAARVGSLFLAVRQQLAELLELAGHLQALRCEEALDRIPETGVADPVRAVGRDRRIAALELVGSWAPASTRAKPRSIANSIAW